MIPTPDQNETDLTKCLRILLGKQDMVEVCYLIKYFKLVRSFLFKELVNTLMVLAIHRGVSDYGHATTGCTLASVVYCTWGGSATTSN